MLKTAPPKVKKGGSRQELPHWAHENLQTRERNQCHPTAAAAAGTVLRPGHPEFHAAGQPRNGGGGGGGGNGGGGGGGGPGHCHWPLDARQHPAGTQ